MANHAPITYNTQLQRSGKGLIFTKQHYEILMIKEATEAQRR